MSVISDQPFFQEWRESEKRGLTHLVLVTANRLRLGKTYAAMRIGEVLDPNFLTVQPGTVHGILRKTGVLQNIFRLMLIGAFMACFLFLISILWITQSLVSALAR